MYLFSTFYAHIGQNLWTASLSMLDLAVVDYDDRVKKVLQKSSKICPLVHTIKRRLLPFNVKGFFRQITSRVFWVVRPRVRSLLCVVLKDPINSYTHTYLPSSYIHSSMYTNDWFGQLVVIHGNWKELLDIPLRVNVYVNSGLLASSKAFLKPSLSLWGIQFPSLDGVPILYYC